MFSLLVSPVRLRLHWGLWVWCYRLLLHNSRVPATAWTNLISSFPSGGKCLFSLHIVSWLRIVVRHEGVVSSVLSWASHVWIVIMLCSSIQACVGVYFAVEEETHSELVLGKRDWKYGQTCFVMTTVNRRNSFCCVKWVPLLISSFFEKGEKNNKWNLFTVVVKKHFRQTFCPASCSRCFYKNLDSRERKVFFRDRMRSHVIAWDRIKYHRVVLLCAMRFAFRNMRCLSFPPDAN